MKDTIFIAGIHGVGKTFYTTLLTEKSKSFKRISASSLIKEDESITDENKKVKDIEHNQRVMIKNFLKIREVSDLIFLFDGHFVLLNKDGNICDIGVEIFKPLSFNEIILFIDDVKDIYSRLKLRDSNNDLTVSQLSKMQDQEVLVAKNISKELDIPLHIINLKNQKKEDILIQLDEILTKYL
ncbi:AAA family ATPase [Aliarcobacter butzleri]|uniref:AAA family ATPase n=1 Tax=Aliarcobacter butzleri TaxID=28197 RepID=UPI003AFA7EC6